MSSASYHMYAIFKADEPSTLLTVGYLYKTKEWADRECRRFTQNWQYAHDWPGWPLRVEPVTITLADGHE